MTNLAYETTLNIPFDAARARVTEALAAEGFGVLTEIDVQTTLKKKLDVTMPRYLILGACNPALAHRAIEIDPGMGLLLPCNVVLRETGSGIVVSIIDPRAMFQVVDIPGLEAVVAEAENRLKRVSAAVGSG